MSWTDGDGSQMTKIGPILTDEDGPFFFAF